MMHSALSSNRRSGEKGNVFFALFAAVALLGVLGVTVSVFVRGPLSSSVKVTRMNVAESQMAVMAQAIVMQSSAGMNCDADPFVEPASWRVPGALPAPTGGGLLPTTINVASTIDPWGSEYGYCVWDHGADTCGSTERLDGANTNAEGQTVIALISAGPDKTFTTTCRTFTAADVNTNGMLGDPGDLPMVGKAIETDDDIIFSYSYREAAGASGGLWSLKSSDENVATIGKNLEVDGDAEFEGAGVFSALSADNITARNSDFIDFLDGLRLPDSATYDPDCDGTTDGVLRRNGSAIEMCMGSDWTDLAGGGGSGGGSNQLGTDTTTVCDSDTAGAIRFNDSLSVPQYCDGVAWRTFATRSAAVLLAVSPSVLELPVIGPCTTDCPYANGPAAQDITVTNIGSVASGNITQSSYNVYINTGSTTCSGPLAPGTSCVFNVSGRTTGNYTLDDGYIDILQGGLPVARLTMHSTGSGFGCSVTGYGWGGQIVSCLNGTTPDYIVNWPGCDGSVSEPRCTGVAADDPIMENQFAFSFPENATTTSGAQNSVNLKGYGTSVAINYCDQLIAQGYDDWFLPSSNQLQTLLYPQRAALQMTGTFWSSTYQGSTIWAGAQFNIHNFTSNSASWHAGDGDYKVRCMRRHNTALPAIQADTSAYLHNPAVNYNESVIASGSSIGASYTPAGTAVYSPIYTIRGVNTPVTVSITSFGFVTLYINGRDSGTSGTAYNGDTISFFSIPTSPGSERVDTINVGSSTFTWTVRTVEQNTRRIFVTSTTHTGNLGGIAGADGICAARATAAGLGGTWYALLGTSTAPSTSRLPWNWARLENMAGEMVAANYRDLFSTQGYNGYQDVIGAPIAYNEFGAWAGNATARTGLVYMNGGITQAGTSFDLCNNWSGTPGGSSPTIGYASSTTWNWGAATNAACSTSQSLYCVGPF